MHSWAVQVDDIKIVAAKALATQVHLDLVQILHFV